MYHPPATVYLLYTNHRGETAWRRIVPVDIRYGECEFHPGKQWLLDAVDLDKQAERTFAMKDVHRWQTEQPQHYQTKES